MIRNVSKFMFKTFRQKDNCEPRTLFQEKQIFNNLSSHQCIKESPEAILSVMSLSKGPAPSSSAPAMGFY